METFYAFLVICARGIHRSPINFPHKDQWRRATIFSLIWTWVNGWVNTREAGDLRRHRAHYDVIVMGIWNANIYNSINMIPTFSILEINKNAIVFGFRELK